MSYEAETGEAGVMSEKSGAATRFVPSLDADESETREFVACHRIALAELPAHRVRALLDAAPCPSESLKLGASVWQASPIGLTEKQIARLTESCSVPFDSKLLERAAASGAYALLCGDPAFPVNLVPLFDTPPLLFVRGELLPGDRYGVAIVGTRRSTPYGDREAIRFAAAFATHGLTVISGGAAGIDTAAHGGALSVSGGRTIAVLGCGVDIVYPSQNRDLFARIVQNGCGAIVSEFAVGTKPDPWRFPTRNRIIAGLARAALLVETPDKSGALGTARSMADYGRDVFVVPGAVDSGRSRGGHRLIQDGAALADSPEDVLTALGVVIAAQEEPPQTSRRRSAPATDSATTPDMFAASTPSPVASAPDLPTDEAAFYAALTPEAQPFDTVAQTAGLASSAASVAATLLEMKSLVRRHPGNLFSRA